ncbi:hypothetical protein ACVNP1_06730 [Staphylococcus aureus]
MAASNKGLRQSLADQCKVNDIQLTIPSPKLCTDNAAMHRRCRPRSVSARSIC